MIGGFSCALLCNRKEYGIKYPKDIGEDRSS